MAPRGGEDEEDGREGDPERHGEPVVHHVGHVGPTHVPPLAGLGPHDLAVHLREADGHGRAEQRRDHDTRGRRMLIQGDDQRQADDHAIDDARNVGRPQVSFEQVEHGTSERP